MIPHRVTVYAVGAKLRGKLRNMGWKIWHGVCSTLKHEQQHTKEARDEN
jgi:hypothetical protein